MLYDTSRFRNGIFLSFAVYIHTQRHTHACVFTVGYFHAFHLVAVVSTSIRPVNEQYKHANLISFFFFFIILMRFFVMPKHFERKTNVNINTVRCRKRKEMNIKKGTKKLKSSGAKRESKKALFIRQIGKLDFKVVGCYRFFFFARFFFLILLLLI